MRYCVVVQLDNSSDLKRVGSDAPQIISLLKAHSDKDEMAFRSNDGILFGWFIQTNKPIGMISGAIEVSTAFRNSDSIMVFEIGDESFGTGFTRQIAWLQHSAK